MTWYFIKIKQRSPTNKTDSNPVTTKSTGDWYIMAHCVLTPYLLLVIF
jgi:hypothetical protein